MMPKEDLPQPPYKYQPFEKPMGLVLSEPAVPLQGFARIDAELEDLRRRLLAIEHKDSWPCDGEGDEGGTFRCKKDKSIADLEARLSRVHGLALAAQIEIENGDADLVEINGLLVEIAETSTQT